MTEDSSPSPTTITEGHIGENTLNSRLAELLRNRGHPSADFELLFPTFRGQRKPDVVFQVERGLIIVSAKFGLIKEIEAVVTAQEYHQTLGQITEVAEAFAVTYPRNRERGYHLRALATSFHDPKSWVLDSLDEVADKIIEVTVEDWERASIGSEPAVTAAIRVLRKAVYKLEASLRDISIDNIYDILGGEFFDTILGFESSEEDDESIRVTRSAAAYLFLNQVMFYEILASEMPDQFPHINIEDYNRPTVLKPKYFDKVLLIDYKPIFSFDVSTSFIGESVNQSCKNIILAVRALFPKSIDHDVLGKVFHNLIEFDLRKAIGAYFTNSQAAQLLANIVINDSSDTVLDPACGSGTLLVASYNRKASLIDGSISESIHQQFVQNDLTGIDVMAFSAHLAAIHLALRAPLFHTENIRIAIGDSTTYQPGVSIQPARETLKSAFRGRRLTDYFEVFPDQEQSSEERNGTIMEGAVQLTQSGQLNDEFTLDLVDAVIMNPPFTSRDNMPPHYREELQHRFSEKRYQKCLKGKISFQANFLLLADKFLKQNGTVASVLPKTTLTGKSFDNLVDYFVQRYTIDTIVTGLGRSAFSDNTSLSELLFIAHKSKPGPNHKFVLLGTKKNPENWSNDDIQSLLAAIQTARETNEVSSTDLYTVKTHFQKDLSQKKKGLTELILQFIPDFSEVKREITELYTRSPLITPYSKLERNINSDLFQFTLRRREPYGISALSISREENRMKKKTDRLLLLRMTNNYLVAGDRFTSRTYKFHRDKLVSSIRRISEINVINVTEQEDFLVSKYYPQLDIVFNEIYDLDVARECRNRVKYEWEELVERARSHICLARRVDIGSPGTHHLALYTEKQAALEANSWGIRDLLPLHARILTLWFNSTLFLFDTLCHRSETRGSWGQIDKRHIVACQVPDLPEITEPDLERFESLFNRIGEVSFPSIMEQLSTNFQGRYEIDDYFLFLLGFEDDERRHELIIRLHTVCLAIIEQMQKAMAAE